jgi:hypothetical protein
MLRILLQLLEDEWVDVIHWIWGFFRRSERAVPIPLQMDPAFNLATTESFRENFTQLGLSEAGFIRRPKNQI